MAHPRHAEVRTRFDYRCGYCSVSERATGGELTVDHFQPLSAGGSDELNNLVYACFKCNQYKSDYFPMTEGLASGQRLLHPLVDPVTKHVRPNDRTGELEPLSDAGRVYIEILQLNRPQLIAHRLYERMVVIVQAEHSNSQAELQQLRAIISKQRVLIDRLRKALKKDD